MHVVIHVYVVYVVYEMHVCNDLYIYALISFFSVTAIEPKAGLAKLRLIECWWWQKSGVRGWADATTGWAKRTCCELWAV